MSVRIPRVSPEQRQKLLEFMQAHEDLGRGRVAGADASRRKIALLGELATILNAMGGGASKTPDKWYKSWQDWRSDTKAKALKIQKYRAGTGGGPSPPPLSQIEETLLTFCGIEMVEGIQGVADPLELEVEATEQCTVEVTVEEVVDDPSTTRHESQRANKNKTDQKLNDILERQAAALEQLPKSLDKFTEVVATSMQGIATAMQGIATAMESIARALDQQQVVVVDPDVC